MVISPSIASGNLMRIEDDVRYICNAFPALHIDIEDGVYLENISFGFKLAKMICAAADKPVSLHLMVQEPMRWITEVRQCGAANTFIHLEHLAEPVAVLQAYQQAGIRTGLGLSSRDQRENTWQPLLEWVDAVLVLTSDIDDPEQHYSPKLAEFAKMLAKCSGKQVWVDGAIDFPMLQELEDAGIYAAVMGRAIFRDRVNACQKAVVWNPHI